MSAPAFLICISFSFHFPEKKKVQKWVSNGFFNSLLKRNPDRDAFWDFAAQVATDVGGRWGAGFRARLLGAALGCRGALFPLGWRFAFSLLERVVRLLHGTDGSVFSARVCPRGF